MKLEYSGLILINLFSSLKYLINTGIPFHLFQVNNDEFESFSNDFYE